MKKFLIALWSCATLSHAIAAPTPLDPPDRPGAFWLKLDPLPVAAVAVDPGGAALRFDSLSALTDHALRTRAESRAAWLGIEAEAARLDAASAANWPTLTGQLSFTRSQTLSSSGASVPVLHRYGPSLGLAYVLYDFGARAAGIDAQRYQLIAALLNNNRTLQDIVTGVETAWFALQAVRAQTDALKLQLDALSASVDAVEVRVQSGLASRADALRARAALAEAELAYRAATRDIAKAEAQLKQAAGIVQTQSLVLDWPNTLPPTLDAALLLADLLAEAERQRPDLNALRAAAARAKSEADSARAARWPSLSLTANAGRTLFLEDERSASNTNSVGVMLSVPLFDGGRLAAEARAAERDAERFAAAADVRQQTVALEVVQALEEVRYAQSARAWITLQFDSADESARAAEARYKAGFGSLLEWLTAQAAQARARQAQAQADSDWLAAFSRLNHALGRLPAALTESPL